jgi:hypothetical protein
MGCNPRKRREMGTPVVAALTSTTPPSIYAKSAGCTRGEPYLTRYLPSSAHPRAGVSRLVAFMACSRFLPSGHPPLGRKEVRYLTLPTPPPYPGSKNRGLRRLSLMAKRQVPERREITTRNGAFPAESFFFSYISIRGQTFFSFSLSAF